MGKLFNTTMQTSVRKLLNLNIVSVLVKAERPCVQLGMCSHKHLTGIIIRSRSN